MLIVCPACASEYEIPAKHVGETGRQVRCASCRETWFITADASVPIEIETAGLPSAIDAPALPSPIEGPVIEQAAPYPQPQSLPARKRPPSKRTRKRPQKRQASLATRLLSRKRAMVLAGIVAVIPLALVIRSPVVAAIPQTAMLFAGIGLPVNLRGIDIRDVTVFQNPPLGDKPGELVVEGDLLGIASHGMPVPDLAIEIRDEKDQTLYRWTAPGPRASLEPDERARFRASLSAPPAAGRSVAVRFADEPAVGSNTHHGATSADASER